MARLRPLSAEDAISILEAHGFRRSRQKGSHVALQRRSAPGTSTRTVIVPVGRELRIGTLLSIVRQSGLDRSLFER